MSAKDIVCLAGCALLSAFCIQAAPPQQQSANPASVTTERALVDKYCVACHSDKLKTGGLSLQSADLTKVPAGAETWEKVIHKVRLGAMPPQGMPRPDAAAMDRFASWLENAIDTAAATHPNPGRATLHRLNRSEYANAIRDLLALEVDPATLLPPDDESYGFDNIADVLELRRRCWSATCRRRGISAVWRWAIPPSAPTPLPIAPSPIFRRTTTSKACRWARAAECLCATISRSMANT